MSSFDDNDWTEAERDLLSSLRDVQPDLPGQEDHTVRALQNRGLVGGKSAANWMRPLQLAGVAAAMVLAFLAGTHYQKQQTPIVERTVAPAEQEALRTGFVAANFDPMDESFSSANSSPKDRMTRSRQQDR